MPAHCKFNFWRESCWRKDSLIASRAVIFFCFRANCFSSPLQCCRRSLPPRCCCRSRSCFLISSFCLIMSCTRAHPCRHNFVSRKWRALARIYFTRLKHGSKCVPNLPCWHTSGCLHCSSTALRSNHEATWMRCLLGSC